MVKFVAQTSTIQKALSFKRDDVLNHACIKFHSLGYEILYYHKVTLRPVLNNFEILNFLYRELDTILHLVKATISSGFMNLPAAVGHAGILVNE